MPFNSEVSLHLPEVPDIADPKLALAITPMHVAVHNLHKGFTEVVGCMQRDVALWPTTLPERSLRVNQGRKFYAKAGVTIAVGQLVNIYDVAGVATLRLATAATPLYAHGISLSAAVAVGDWVEVQLVEGLVAVGGLTAGASYYLSTIAGTMSAAPAANRQLVGIALSPTHLYLRINLI